MQEKGIVVFSGGQDSTTCLFIAISKLGAKNVIAVSFDYGQRHSIELESAATIAKMAGVEHQIVKIPPEFLMSTSPLTSDAELAKYKDHDSMEAEVGTKVESTFVPMRNSLFLTIAANRAIALGVKHIYTGVCEADNANYPDCTLTFIRVIEHAINQSLGCRMIEIETPLIRANKRETVELSYRMPDCWNALAYSHTSYDGKYPPTDMNHANILRAKGFEDANKCDPLVVRAYREGLMELPLTKNYDELRGVI